jgi:spore coat protein U-like protein
MWMVAPIHCRKLHFKKKGKSMKMNIKQNSTKLAIVAGILVGSAGLTVPVFADSEDTTMLVSAGIGKNCVITTTNIAFGTYDPIVAHATAALEASGSVTTTCTIGTAGEVLINYGEHADEGSTDRLMIGLNEAGTLGYEVYSDGSRTIPWSGEADSGVDINAAGVGEVMTVYASIPGGQTTAANDSYNDTLTVTVAY